MVQPGQSAVFFVGESDDPAKIVEHFRGNGGTIPHDAAAGAATAED